MEGAADLCPVHRLHHVPKRAAVDAMASGGGPSETGSMDPWIHLVRNLSNLPADRQAINVQK